MPPWKLLFAAAFALATPALAQPRPATEAAAQVRWSEAKHLAVEFPDGRRLGAVFSVQRNDYVRASVFNEHWRRATPNSAAGGKEWDSYHINMNFRPATGELIPNADSVDPITGKPLAGARLIVSPVDLLTDFDVPNRKVRMRHFTEFEYRDMMAADQGEVPVHPLITALKAKGIDVDALAEVVGR